VNHFSKVRKNRSFLEKLIARGLEEKDLEAIIRKKRADETCVNVSTIHDKLTPEEFERMVRVQRPGPRKRRKRDPRHDTIARLRALSRDPALEAEERKLMKQKADRLKKSLTPKKKWIKKPWRKIHKEIIYDLVAHIEPIRERVNCGWGENSDYHRIDSIRLVAEILDLPFNKVNNDFYNYYRQL